MPLAARLLAVTIDAPDPLELARFYQAIAGGVVTRGSDDFVVLSGGPVRMDFQRVANPAAGWPDGSPRRVHLDLVVDDLAEGEAYALQRGAVTADHQPGGQRFRVMFDPAGHPFCLVDAAAGAPPTEASPTEASPTEASPTEASPTEAGT
jgi:hypothetical protein